MKLKTLYNPDSIVKIVPIYPKRISKFRYYPERKNWFGRTKPSYYIQDDFGSNIYGYHKYSEEQVIDIVNNNSEYVLIDKQVCEAYQVEVHFVNKRISVFYFKTEDKMSSFITRLQINFKLHLKPIDF